MFIDFLQRLKLFILPSCCVLCGDLSKRDIALCVGCEADLPKISNPCIQCALPLGSDENVRCGYCLQHRPDYDRTISLLSYEAPIDRLIGSLKFHNKLLHADLFARLMTKHLRQRFTAQDQMPEIIIPVPLHKRRLRMRGFNQALELAKPIARELQIPIDLHRCQRIKNTSPQTLTASMQRKSNLRNAFKVTEKLPAKHVAIFDDVVTTGNTVSELSRVLKSSGVERVDVWCVARTEKLGYRKKEE